jgi:hypothetical protein
VLRVELSELHPDPLCLVHVLLALVCMKKLLRFDLALFLLRLI